MAGDVLRVTARVRLDWSDPAHWSSTAAACHGCHTPTFGRDGQGRAIHQSCAEAELAAEMAGQFAGGITDERRPVGYWRMEGTR